MSRRASTLCFPSQPNRRRRPRGATCRKARTAGEAELRERTRGKKVRGPNQRKGTDAPPKASYWCFEKGGIRRSAEEATANTARVLNGSDLNAFCVSQNTRTLEGWKREPAFYSSERLICVPHISKRAPFATADSGRVGLLKQKGKQRKIVK